MRVDFEKRRHLRDVCELSLFFVITNPGAGKNLRHDTLHPRGAGFRVAADEHVVVPSVKVDARIEGFLGGDGEPPAVTWVNRGFP